MLNPEANLKAKLRLSKNKNNLDKFLFFDRSRRSKITRRSFLNFYPYIIFKIIRFLRAVTLNEAYFYGGEGGTTNKIYLKSSINLKGYKARNVYKYI